MILTILTLWVVVDVGAAFTVILRFLTTPWIADLTSSLMAREDGVPVVFSFPSILSDAE